MDMKNAPLLEMKNIEKSFYGNQVLNDINITLNEGDVLGLCGENGAGKSTLMKILFGMQEIEQTGGFEGNVFCLFSVSESFGLAAVEAQMNKIPAIVSQVGGLQYTVVTNKSGFVVPSNDLDAATNAMLYAINNPEKMIEMGNFAFEYVNQNFHENHYVDNLFNFYRDILK